MRRSLERDDFNPLQTLEPVFPNNDIEERRSIDMTSLYRNLDASICSRLDSLEKIIGSSPEQPVTLDPHTIETDDGMGIHRKANRADSDSSICFNCHPSSTSQQFVHLPQEINNQ
jgi:hypothetical protein